VSSREVEEVIYEMEGVSEVAVIGVPDDYWIEAITAVVVPKAGVTITKSAVIDFCKDKLSKFKVPKYIAITNELPKNPSGKILKRELRDLYENIANE
ncbi:acyl-CoA synthetase, partial [Butyricicoccus sp. 1XD8-22]